MDATVKVNGSRGKNPGNRDSRLHYSSVSRDDVPQSRKGKHNTIVTEILQDVQNIPAGKAIKIPIAGMESSIQKVRSALSRGVRKQQFQIATASDDTFLYVWRKDAPRG